MPHPDFDLQGHRGARGLFPENTLHGFRAAARLGVQTMELDVGTTRDGAVVVHHDPALNPDTTRDGAGRWLDGPGPLLRDLTLAQLREYDVGRLRPGTPYAEAYPGQAAQDGAGIPTLDEVLATDAVLLWNIELKVLPTHPDWTIPAEEMVERVLHVVGAAGAGPRVALQSFDWRAPRHLRRIRPAIAAGWLTAASSVADAPLWLGRHLGGAADVPDAVAAEGGGTWAPHHADLTKDLLDRAHDLGLRVVPWTVNAADDMQRLMDWGVDGLISDLPDRALVLLGRPGRERPAGIGRTSEG
jgi:glycerophosphoryl diester phosphodiesterase